MTRFLMRIFLKKQEDPNSPKTRAAYGTLSSCVGIFCNILLFFVKFLMGLLSNSVAVTADAFNNLSDVGSSAISFLGFHMASKPADRDHPFGHGRIEYLCGLIISFLILLVGLDFVKSSIERIFNPSPVTFSWIVIAALVCSILVKLWMSRFNRTLAKEISSAAIAATANDSISDVLATGVTLLSVILSQFTVFPVDGVMGVLVAGVILYAGYTSASDTITPLLGQAPDPVLIENVTRCMLSYDGILGIHDLIVHDYGPGRVFVSAHAEVSVNANILKSHEIIDLAEREITEQLGVHMLIHMDPIDTDCEETNQLRQLTRDIVASIDPDFTIHDFRVVLGEQITNLIFDVCVPVECRKTDAQLTEEIQARLRQVNPKYQVVLTVDRSYASQASHK